MEATITISYDIIVRRTIIVDAKDDEISELLSMDNSSYLQLPKSTIDKFDTMNVSSGPDVIQSFPTNITVTADYDEPDDMIISK